MDISQQYGFRLKINISMDFIIHGNVFYSITLQRSIDQTHIANTKNIVHEQYAWLKNLGQYAVMNYANIGWNKACYLFVPSHNWK